MAENWSRLECEAIVEDYLQMLSEECRGENYSKTEHRRNLRKLLQNRSDGSIEYKHQNISAVLIRAGHTYVRGYKPAWNYQDLLEDVVLDRVQASKSQLDIAEERLSNLAPERLPATNRPDLFVDPPDRLPERKIQEPRVRRAHKIDYVVREAANRRLGESGESFVLEVEKQRLATAGRNDLVDRVEWTSKVRGDGTGYDLQSFEPKTGDPLYIEVKTTNSGKYQPFLISANEVRFSDEYANHFALYRVFDFSRSPSIFVLGGAVGEFVDLSPAIYRASF